MSYSKLYFGKELTDLTFADIENYFVDEKEESDKIEFKSYQNLDEKNHSDKEKGVLRTICGLLNSEGGLIIWGAPIGKKVDGKNEKVFQGELSPCNMAIGKDSFINKVADSITPSPNGIKFQPLEKDGQFVYVIEVDQSFYSPHQFKNMYFMRMDGQTKPAPHHYIEALFRKVTFPKLEGYVQIETIKQFNSNYVMRFNNFILNQSKLQNEYNIYYRLIITTGKFNVHTPTNTKSYSKEKQEIVDFNAREIHFYSEVLINTETILFTPSELFENNNELDIIFVFGGKQSPLLISEYKYLININNPQSPSYDLHSKSENQYVYEKEYAVAKSEKEITKTVIES